MGYFSVTDEGGGGMEEPTPLVQRRQQKRKNDGLIGSKILGDMSTKTMYRYHGLNGLFSHTINFN